MNILITGGAGYIGSVLTRHLLECGHKVRVLDNLTYGGNHMVPLFGNERFGFQNGDVRRLEDCENAVRGIDYVIHLAAIVGEPAVSQNELASIRTNVDGTKNIYQASKGKPFVFASTCSNYGQALLATEKTELKPHGLYAEQKGDMEQWLLEQGNCTILRFATAYGFSPRMRLDLMIQQFVFDAYMTGKLEIYNPDAWRPFVHVQDIARAIEIIVDTCPRGTNGQIYNVGGTNVTKRMLADKIKDLMPRVEITTRETGDGRDYCVSFNKIRDVFGFYTEYSPWGFMPQLISAHEMGVFSATRYENTIH